MQYIRLTQGYVTAIDQADHDRIADFKWFAQVVRRADGSVLVYAMRNVPREGGGQTKQLMHRLLLDAPDGMHVDHINGNGLDNRRANLRVCSHAENMRNRRPRTGGSSAYKGVSWHRREARWRAQIMLEGKNNHLGYFTSEADAATAYDAAASKYHGEFARANG